MPLPVRRLVYGLLAALGFAFMVPQAVAVRRFQSTLLSDPTSFESVFDPTAGGFGTAVALSLIGLIVASLFLYLALSTGHPKAWRPRENGGPSCRRCGARLRFGVGRCPTCDQQLVW